MYQIFLKNGAEIQATSMTFEPHIVCLLDNRAALTELWDQLTPENLAIFEVYADGRRLTGFTDTELVGINIVPNADGDMTVHFYFTGQIQEAIDPDYKTAYEVVTGAYDA